MDSDSFSSAAEELKGKAKQAVGDLTGNEELEDEGRLDEAHGDAKQDVENAEDDLEEAATAEAELRDAVE
jgi:uncharacterized protein YjbJ (UPF0337 family)